MDVFDYCLKAIFYESDKFNVFFNKENCKINNSIDEQFDITSNRLAYMYKFGIFNVLFFKKCFASFLNNCPESSKVIEHIHFAKTICLLSIGPGTDIIGLLFAFHEIGKTLNKQISFRIITKSGAWRNTMNALTSIGGPKIPSFGSFDLLQCDILTSFLPKAQKYLMEADVVLMDHPFASVKAQKHVILNTLKMILKVLSPGVHVIVIDTKTKLSYFESMSSYGNFIHGPTEIQADDLPCRERVVELIGEEPVRSGKAQFGIWCRNDYSDFNLNGTMLINVIRATKKPGSLTHSNVSTPLHKCNSKSISMPSSTPQKILRDSHIIDNRSNTSDIVYNPNLSTSTAVSPKMEIPQHYVTDRSDIINSYSANSGTSLPTLNQTNTHLETTDTIFNLNSETFNSFNNTQNPGNEISVLLKSFDSLIEKFETFVSSKMIPEETRSILPSSQIQPDCNLSRYRCCNTIYCCPCVTMCSRKTALNVCGNVHSFCQCLSNRNECISYQAPVMQDDISDSSYQMNPHIVIPLQNVNTENIAQVMSLARQKKP